MIIDLSLETFDGFTTPGVKRVPKMSILDAFTFEATKGSCERPCQGFSTHILVMPDHLGTHVDAPSEFIVGGDSIEALPVESFFGESVLIDVSERAVSNNSVLRWVSSVVLRVLS